MPPDPTLTNESIVLRGVRTHNLKGIDLDLPRHRFVVICGRSGAGKTSLALDTLHAEGRRRYVETLSTYVRQQLDRIEQPPADQIVGVPATVALERPRRRSHRQTVGDACEINPYLSALFARAGARQCPACGAALRDDSPDSAAQLLHAVPSGAVLLVGFLDAGSPDGRVERLGKLGFNRAVAGDRIQRLDDPATELGEDAVVLVDRVRQGSENEGRLLEALATAFDLGEQICVFSDQAPPADTPAASAQVQLDGATWHALRFARGGVCASCGRAGPPLAAGLFRHVNPLGACETCEGYGTLLEVDPQKVVPDVGKTLREGAVAPWNSPAYEHELQELVALSDDFGIPLDVPFRQLAPAAIDVIQHGAPERDFGGLDGFFAWLERKRYKINVASFVSRWKSRIVCHSCEGTRLKPDAAHVFLGEVSYIDCQQMTIEAAARFFNGWTPEDDAAPISAGPLMQVRRRLAALKDLGLGSVALGAAMAEVADGEAHRAAVAAALGSSLVNVLYVLDEPTVGLHADEVRRVSAAFRRLCDRGASVLAVDNDEALIASADQVVELGPEGGAGGGEVVYQGSPSRLADCPQSPTMQAWAGRAERELRNETPSAKRWIRLRGAKGRNLQGVDIEIPIGAIVAVTGVSGAGKSSLVVDTFYRALRRAVGGEADAPLPYDELSGWEGLDGVELVDRQPLVQSRRSCPATYVKAFDEIRAAFASTPDAKRNNMTAGRFSFNSAAGRCPTCGGEGLIHLDMQFLADVAQTCPDCRGRRYQDEVLQYRYRDRTIADVLEMTVRGAFAFFRGKRKLQARLQPLIDVGLHYLAIGQSLATLSGGEAQRLKIAQLLTASGGRSMLVLEEPCAGLHPDEVDRVGGRLRDAVQTGATVVAVEHRLQFIADADWVIDLGPGAGADGGRITAAGTPLSISLGDGPTAEALRAWAAGGAVNQAATSGPSHEAAAKR